MFTDQRLTEAYTGARVELFDGDSRYVFFSDAHRGDNSLSDEFARNQNIFLSALDYYLEEGFVAVETGDGEELWEHSKFKHIRFAHSEVYDALKRFHDDNRLILLYGNHNMYLKDPVYLEKNFYHFYDEYSEEYCELFEGLEAHEALVLRHRETGQEILALHGHQGDFMNDQIWRFSMLALRYFWRFMHMIGFRNPASPAKNVHKMHKIERNYNKWIARHRMMLICGHTHRPKFPKHGELPYFNSGCGVHTKGISCIEIVNNEILLVEWRIRTARDGILRVEREIVRGPQAVEKYDLKKYQFNEVV
ncbi:metallophosphoesterase family protein [Acidaminobacter hydrogenoformans]|uniref:UDP-2,3-diacylglucosamine pyrophosphatase LpxH n=1 Tax=Acidaminobacter hydrogenoformans DSM 2784 TaxID=1120920 RepID=A0A1G5S6P7_9FIRM|nr:serine/threonine protein phosphatase [Acidaminobacter hydrogenoformans]SCZ81996.1 UDP-2,3-diacylglucosamine pyrophosphatase LpxH [Acidaminobacter hydrogenoformans DSM 2784]